MSLRWRTVLTISLTSLIMIGILYGAARFIILSSFTALERADMQDNVARLQAAVGDELSRIASTNQDYAAWNDSYVFVQDGNQQYAESNMLDDAIANLKLNVVVYVRLNGERVFGKGLDLTTQHEAPLPASLDELLTPESPLVALPRPGMNVTGLLMLPEGPLLVDSRPILTTEGQGPVHGVLIHGRFLDADLLEDMGAKTRLQVSAQPWAQLAASGADAIEAGLAANAVFIRPAGEQTVIGCGLLNDIYGRPGLVLQVDRPRSIYQRGQTTISYTLLALVAFGVVFAAVVLLDVERLALRRITRLATAVGKIAAQGTASARIEMPGRDEVAHLGASINEMLSALERTQREVQDRTSELARANEMLRASLREKDALLKENESLARFPLEDPNPVFRVAADGTVLLANDASATLLESWGSASGRPLPETWRDFVAGLLRSGADETIEVDCGRRTLSLCFVPLADAGYANVYGLDVTEHKKLTEQFLQAQKMEMVGRLAGGVAHDFNNLLTAIGGYAGFVKKSLPPGASAHADIDQVIAAGERAARLTRQLLAFSRRQIIARKVVDLNRLILEVGNLLHRLIGEDIELVTLPGPDLWRVTADAGQIEQVLINLAVNARDAMPDGGKLTIETANVTLDGSVERVAVGAGDYVRLTVGDTGSGMTEDVKAHLFEPFYTTKEVGRGTGLGLATVYGIIKQHEGDVWVDSQPGLGTRFEIYLPRTGAEATARSDDETAGRGGPTSAAPGSGGS